MTAEAQKYTITNLVDMVAIPADRFPAFLAELADWHKGMHESGAADLFALISKAGQPLPELELTWCDDNDPGLKELNISVSFRKEDGK